MMATGAAHLLSDGGLGDRVFLVTKWANRLHSFSSAPENLARGARTPHLHHHEMGIRAVLDARTSFGCLHPGPNLAIVVPRSLFRFAPFGLVGLSNVLPFAH